MQLGRAIYARRRALLLRTARHIVGFLAEHIVGGNLNQQSVHLLHRLGEVLRGIGVQFLGECRQFLIGLTSIHIGPCGTVDDDIDIILLHHLADGIHIRDVEVSGLKPLHLVDIREDIAVCGILANDSHLIAELTVGTSYEYIHFL